MINIRRPNADMTSIESRLAAHLAGAINLRSQTLPHDISERLRFGREQALLRLRDKRVQAAPGSAVTGWSPSGAATLGLFGQWGQRAASILPLVVLVCGILTIERWSTQEQVLAAAEIDAQLLSDSLPPAAYSDPGFAEFLKSNPSP